MQKRDKSNPSEFPRWLEVHEAAAIIALAKGEADADTQKKAFKVIVEQISQAYEFNYHPNSQRNTDFALGRSWVGQVLVGIIKSGTEPFRQKGKQDGGRDTPGNRHSATTRTTR